MKIDRQTKKNINSEKIIINISKEHEKFKYDIENCFKGLDITVKVNHLRFSENSLSPSMVIMLGDVISSGLTYDLLKYGIKKIYKHFKNAQIKIEDHNLVVYVISPDNRVNALVMPDYYSEFEHIKTLDDLIIYLKDHEDSSLIERYETGI